MSFIDYLFIPALLLFVLCYFLLPMQRRWVAVLIVSVLFFCTWGIELLPWAVVAALISWRTAIQIEDNYAVAKVRATGTKSGIEQTFQKNAKKENKAILTKAIFWVLGFLIYTKAQKFLVDIPVAGWLLGIFSWIHEHMVSFFLAIPGLNYFVQDVEAVGSDGFSLIVPLGVSYYTMSLVGYMLDVYWRKEQAERNFFKLLLFTLYFPKILQGPITKHREIAKELYSGCTFDYQRFCFGLQRMLWGYFKKLVIADRLSILIDPIFSGYSSYSGSVLFFAAICGAFQLYCDFSGCVDMANGASIIIGVKLPENFKQPFFAKSAADFWRRWHITLSRWYKDYIYMPLVIAPWLIQLSGWFRNRYGRRAGKIVVAVIPTILIWVLTGLWHGTGWNYLMWGLYWGMLMILASVFEPEINRVSSFLKLDTQSGWFQKVRMIRTFLLFVVSRVITIPTELEATGTIFSKIFLQFDPWKLVDGSLLNLGISGIEFVVLLFAIVVLWYVDRVHEQGISIRERVAQYPIMMRWIIYIGGILTVLIFGAYGVGYDASSFVYMNF